MSDSRDRVLFWCLLGGQALGSQVLIWGGLPVYHQMRVGEIRDPGATVFAQAFAVTAWMQVCHWWAVPIKHRLKFRRNVLFGHVLNWIGELSLFFSAALTALIVFDRFGEVEIVAWKALALGAVLFAVTSYKYQVMSLGAEMIEAEARAAAARPKP